MTKLIGISGSLRKGSFNTALLRAAAEHMPAGTSLEIASIREIPLYDGDLEAQGMPKAVVELQNAIAGADGVLLVTPEYNNSIPGVMKNAIDWLSRPPKEIPRVFADRPFGLIGATPGQGGTNLSQLAWLAVLRTLGAQLWTGGRLGVPSAGKVFDEHGAFRDSDEAKQIEERLKKYLAGFVAFAARSR